MSRRQREQGPDLHPWAVGMTVVVERRFKHGDPNGRPLHQYEQQISRLTATRAYLGGRYDWIERDTGLVRPKYCDYRTTARPKPTEAA